MAVFAYKAFNARGECIDGSVIADTPASARHQLRGEGLRLLDVRAVPFAKRSRRRAGRRQREQAADFARQLALLLRAGITLVEAMDVLSRQQRGRMRPVLQDVRDRVAAGVAMSEAMEGHAEWFDEVFRTAVRVGQLSGRMDQALITVAEYLRERETIRARVVNALAYPCVLLILGTGVILFLMSYVVPQLLSVLQESGGELPLPTQILKGFSDFLVGDWLLLATVGAALAGAAWAVNRWPAARLRVHSLQLRLPLYGALVKKALVAQFAQTMGMLLQNGVPFLGALRLAQQSCRHLVLKNELAAMHEAVARGSDIAPTLAQSRIFPPLVVHIVNVGQKAGELTEMLVQLKEGYETEVRLAVARFATVLEPAMIVLMSLLVGLVVLATMLPILETTRAIH